MPDDSADQTRWAALFSGRAASAMPAVPDWVRGAFGGHPVPAALRGQAADERSGDPPRAFRLAVDGVLTTIELPQVGATILESGEAGDARFAAALRLRLAAMTGHHLPGLRAMPARGRGSRFMPLPLLPAANLIRRLQRFMPRSETRFDPLFRLRLYPVLSERALTGELRALNRTLRPLRCILAKVPLRPAHNRLTPASLRVSGQGLQAVGWRAADMNDPIWDPAVLAQGAGIDRGTAARLLRAVLRRPPTVAEHARFCLYRVLVEAIEVAESDLRRGRGGSDRQEARPRAAAIRRLRRRMASQEYRAAVGRLGRHGRGAGQ